MNMWVKKGNWLGKLNDDFGHQQQNDYLYSNDSNDS